MDSSAAVESQAVVEPPSQGAENQTRATAVTHGNLVDEAARVAATLNDKLPTLSQETRLPGQNHRDALPEGTREPPESRDENREAFAAFEARDDTPFAHAEAEESEASKEGVATARTPGAQTDTRGGRMRQRAASVGASVGGNLRPRVEKLREASTVVFDEASDDPGLRFVIIATLLFLLFLFILLFSYILG
jgi:hypothetical protein